MFTALELGSIVGRNAAEISEDWETGRAYLAPSAEAELIGSRGCPRTDDLDPARCSTPRAEKNENPS
jgi:hypothetical protein